MKFYLASANCAEIQKAYLLPIAGVLTNASIIKKEKKNLRQLVTEIDQIGHLPFGLQISKTVEAEMLEETRLFQSLVHNRTLHLKIPYCHDAFGLLTKLANTGMELNLTGVSTFSQACLALEAKPDYLSIYVGRVTDAGKDGLQLIKDIKEYSTYHQKRTKIVAASIRNIGHLEEVAKAGADAVAIPYDLLVEALESEITENSIVGFKQDWLEVEIG